MFIGISLKCLLDLNHYAGSIGLFGEKIYNIIIFFSGKMSSGWKIGKGMHESFLLCEKIMFETPFFQSEKEKQQIEESEKSKEKAMNSDRSIESAVFIQMNADSMGRYASAATEYHKAYSGINYQAQGSQKMEMEKSLSKIHNMKRTNDYDRNLKQQSGFAAEVMEVADKNAQEIAHGGNRRYSRTDDMQGHKVNETRTDVVLLDENGNEILGADGNVLGYQMKYVKIGKTPEETANELVSNKFREKYPDGKYCVAKDKYEGIKMSLTDQETNLQKQIDRMTQDGNTQKAAELKEKQDYVRKVRDNLVQGAASEEEAMYSVEHPKEWRNSKIAQMSNEAGIECAKSAATTTAVISLVRNVAGFLKGDVDGKEAVKNIAKDTAKSAASGYVFGYANTVIASSLQNSSTEMLRTFAVKYPNAPAQIIAFTTQSISVIGKTLSGELSTEECFFQLGKIGAVMAGSGVGRKIGEQFGKMIGQAYGPVGAMVGSFIGSVVTSVAIDVIGAQLQRLKMSNALLEQESQRLEEVKTRYEEICRVQDEFDRQFRETYIAYTEKLRAVMGDAVLGMAHALKLQDADAFIEHANSVTHTLGEKTQFHSVNEFEKLVANKITLEL